MDSTEEPRRHSWLQEEARMLTPLYRAGETTGNAWRQDALCSQLLEDEAAPPNAWFAPDGSDQSLFATRTCDECPVRLHCLQWACAAKIRYGIWGGQPASVRLQKNGPCSPHDFDLLKVLPNPYNTSDVRSTFHKDKIEVWDGVDDDD